MEKSQSQKELTEVVFEGDTNQIDAGVSDSGNNVILEAGGTDARFTAVEARIFANELYNVSHIEWDTTENDVIWRYILDLADVVEGKITTSEFKNKWQL